MHDYIDLGPIERPISPVVLPWFPILIEGRAELGLSLVPLLLSADVLLWPR